MANQYFNFGYNPVQQGFNASTWRTIYGDAAVSNGKLAITKGAILHYADILRGDATFSVKTSVAPAFDDNFTFGFLQYAKNVYLYFKVNDGVLTAETSNGTVTTSTVIDWQTEWTNADTEFRIKWEAGTATFFIGGQFKVAKNDTYTLEVPVVLIPGDPMSLYMANDSVSTVLLNYITVKSIQSFVMSEGNSDSRFETFVTESDRARITESVTAAMAAAEAVNKADTANISEAVTIQNDRNNSVSDTTNMSESVTVNTPA